MKEIVLNTGNFDETIAAGCAMVDFWAEWCGPCRMLAPAVASVAEEYSDLTVGKVNVDENPALCTRFGIDSIPTLLFFKDGKLTDQSVGLISSAEIEAHIARLLAL